MSVVDAMNKDASGDNQLPENTEAEDFGIFIRIKPSVLGDFIKDILGQPQAVVKRYLCTFDLNLEDLKNFHHLIIQRVLQQHNATLVEFSAVIVFEDGYLRKLGSFRELETFHEVRQAVSVGARIFWTFLIKFPGSTYPEKQEIQLRISRWSGLDISTFYDDLPPYPPSSSSAGVISHEIQYTERTWAEDIDNMLRNHINSITCKDSKIRKFVRKRAFFVGLATACFSYIPIVLFSISARYVDLQNARARFGQLGDVDTTVLQRLDAKLDLLSEWLFKNMDTYALYGAIYVLSILCVASIGIWVSNLARRWPPSFIVLTNEAEKERVKKLASTRRRMANIAVSFFGSVLASITAAAILAYLKYT